MTKKYKEEFKKQLGNEYLNGTSYPSLEKAYGVAKSTISGSVKKYSEECQYTKPLLSAPSSQSAKEIHEWNKKIAAFFAKEIDSWCINSLIIIRNFFFWGGVRWLLRKFSLSLNSYYNYLKKTKSEYQKQRQRV